MDGVDLVDVVDSVERRVGREGMISGKSDDFLQRGSCERGFG